MSTDPQVVESLRLLDLIIKTARETDPLWTLLADDAAAIELLAAASYNGAFPGEDWAAVDTWHQDYWRRIKLPQSRAIVAALRSLRDPPPTRPEPVADAAAPDRPVVDA